MQVQCRSKTCASKKDDLAKLQLLYKDDSEYNECYAEEWEERDSFKKLIATATQDIPDKIEGCNCILPCAATKIKRLPPETEGSRMELPWTQITIPERCDIQPTAPCSKQRCTCKLSSSKDVTEKPKSHCTCTKKTALEERKSKCSGKIEQPKEEQKPKCGIKESAPVAPIGEPKSAIEKVKFKCTCERKPLKTSAEAPTPKCSYDQKMSKPAEEPKPKCNCEQKTAKDPKPKCAAEEMTKPAAEELRPSCILERIKPVLGETRGKCSCQQQTTPSVEEQKLKCSCKEQMQKPRETKVPCDCKRNAREPPLNLPKCVSGDSKEVMKTCSGRKAARDLPTRIPTPVISMQKSSREDEAIPKPPEKMPGDMQRPSREERKGPCDCETNLTKETEKLSQKLEQSAPKSDVDRRAFDDDVHVQWDDPGEDNGGSAQGSANEAPANNDEDAPQQPENRDEPEQSASGSGVGGTGGDDGRKPPGKDEASRPCECARSEGSMDEEQRCLEESRRNPMKLVYDNLCYEANEPYMDPLSKIYPDDCETYCGPSTEIPWSEILIPKGVKLRQAKKSKREKCKTTRSTNTDTDINKKLL